MARLSRLAPLATLLALLGPAQAAAARETRVALGHLAGYVWARGPVGSVGATFTVPRIGSRSRPGAFAATWIGAQAPGAHGAFIQVGVDEIRTEPQRGLPSHDLYYAFWSDTRLHFLGRPLFGVLPGDEIVASLRRARGGWRVAILDAGRRVARHFLARYGTRAPFAQAEWLQENPHTAGGRQLPYPRLSPVRFRDIWVNSARPRHAASEWLSTPRAQIGPTRLRDGSFRLRRRHLSRAGAAYWRLALPLDAAAERFYARVVRWRDGTPAAAIARASAQYATALRANLGGLAAASWPPRLRAAAGALIARTRALLGLVELAPARASAHLRSWSAAYLAATAALRRAGRRLVIEARAPEIAY